MKIAYHRDTGDRNRKNNDRLVNYNHNGINNKKNATICDVPLTGEWVTV